jgi:hypothetical protein
MNSKLALTLLLATAVSYGGVKRTCDRDLKDDAFRPLSVTLHGSVTTEEPDSMEVGSVSYQLRKVADYSLGRAFVFGVAPGVQGVMDYFVGRESIYINSPSNFTLFFRTQDHCGPQISE